MDEDKAAPDVDVTTNNVVTLTLNDEVVASRDEAVTFDNPAVTCNDEATTNNAIVTTTDVTTTAPDEAVQPLMGSSRISGGIFRGHAHGNVPNHADLMTMTVELKTPVKGEVYLYLTEQYPRHVKFELLKGESELVVVVQVVGSIAPILEMVARKFSVIQSECILLIELYFKPEFLI